MPVTVKASLTAVERGALEQLRQQRANMDQSLTAEQVVEQLANETLAAAVANYTADKLPALKSLGVRFLNLSDDDRARVLEILGTDEPGERAAEPQRSAEASVVTREKLSG